MEIVGVTIGRVDPLERYHVWRNPFVRVHAVRASSGELLYTSVAPDSLSCTAATQPCNVAAKRLNTPLWKETLQLQVDYRMLVRAEEGIALVFEIYERVAEHTWVGEEDMIAWAFLRPTGRNGRLNTGRVTRIQLFTPEMSKPRGAGIGLLTKAVNKPAAGEWLANPLRANLPGSLHVCVHPVAARPRALLDGWGMSLPGLGASETAAAAAIFKPIWGRAPEEKCVPPDTVLDRLPTGRGGCLSIQFSRSGVYLAAAICDNSSFPIRIFQIAGLGNVGVPPSTMLFDLSGHSNIVYDMAWSHDDSLLASASSDSTACVWSLARGTEPVLCLQHPCFVYCVRLHPSRVAATSAITGAYDGVIRVWQLDSGVNIELPGHQASVNAIELDPSGYKMFSADSAGVVKVWLFNEGWKPVFSFSCQDVTSAPIMALRMHPVAPRLLVHARDSIVRAIDTRTYAVVQRFPGAVNSTMRVRSSFSACGSLVLAGSEDGYARVWDADHGTLLRKYESLGAPVSDAAFHPCDNIFAVCAFAQDQPIILYCYRAPAVPPSMPAGLGSSKRLTELRRDAGAETLPRSTREQTIRGSEFGGTSLPRGTTQRHTIDQAPGFFVQNSGLAASVAATPAPRALSMLAPGGDALETAYEQHLSRLERTPAHPFGIDTTPVRVAEPPTRAPPALELPRMLDPSSAAAATDSLADARRDRRARRLASQKERAGE
eukprot:m.128928 g.128928  ORF g.128928 m.128928 type:complete len:715 (+) comp9423_c0_seq1:39-2183(+)